MIASLPRSTEFGLVFSWSGLIANIPKGFVLCDGNNGTPDLRDDFIVGAGLTFAENGSGGVSAHIHTATSDGHAHGLPFTTDIAPPAGITAFGTDTKQETFTSDPATKLPPFYALAYIMRL